MGMDMGRRISEARRARGMTKAALAEAVGCAPLSIINWEKGVRTPLVIYREKLEAVLGISLKEGSDGDKHKAPPDGGACD